MCTARCSRAMHTPPSVAAAGAGDGPCLLARPPDRRRLPSPRPLPMRGPPVARGGGVGASTRHHRAHFQVSMTGVFRIESVSSPHPDGSIAAR